MNKNNSLIHTETNGNPNIIGGGMTGTGRSVIESITDKYPTIEDLVEVLKEKGHDALADQLTCAAKKSKMLHPELIKGNTETEKNYYVDTNIPGLEVFREYSVSQIIVHDTIKDTPDNSTSES